MNACSLLSVSIGASHIYLYTMTYLHLILDFYGQDVDHTTSKQNSDSLSDFATLYLGKDWQFYSSFTAVEMILRWSTACKAQILELDRNSHTFPCLDLDMPEPPDTTYAFFRPIDFQLTLEHMFTTRIFDALTMCLPGKAPFVLYLSLS